MLVQAYASFLVGIS